VFFKYILYRQVCSHHSDSELCRR